MKVLFCAYDGGNCINGVNTWLMRLLPSLRDKGVTCRILFVTWAPDDECITLSAMRRMGFDCVVVPPPYFTENHVRWILKYIASNVPDVFVPGNVLPGLYAAQMIQKSGIPTVGILHNNDRIYNAIEDEFIFIKPEQALSAVVCVSQFLEESLRSRNPPRTLVRNIPCGVPISGEKVKTPDENLKLIYLGRLVEEQKRISEVTRTLCRAVKEIPGVTATIYGSGPAQSSVEKIIAQKGDGFPIFFKGFISNDKIKECLLDSHVLVLLSDYEGLPVSVMEAMAYGVVPVCSKIKSGIPELVEDGVTGFLVNDRRDEFITTIHRLKQSQELWKKMSEAAYNKIKDKYSHSFCVSQWIDLLQELTSDQNRIYQIKVPKRLQLPSVKPDLRELDPRQPAIYTRVLRKIQREIKTINILG